MVKNILNKSLFMLPYNLDLNMMLIDVFFNGQSIAIVLHA